MDIIHYDAKNPGECYGGHQMLAVGWNEQGLIVCNSWGESYGVGFSENQTTGGLIIIHMIICRQNLGAVWILLWKKK